MRQFDPHLHAHLQENATTLCTCWIVYRPDGVRMGFTDHDRNLTIKGVECAASSGFHPTEAVADLGLSSDNQDIEGAISADSITVEDLKAGRFDGAKVQIWAVNWQNPKQRHHMRTAILGEISREDHLFKAELRGMTSLLDQKQGRTFSRGCDAVLGDARCGVNLNQAALKTSGEVSQVNSRLDFFCTGLNGFAEGWFSAGLLTWVSGENAGLSVEISNSHEANGGQLRLWKAMPFVPQIGDRFDMSAGCDKQFSTCKSKYSNANNFRGFPHMPGSDFVLGYASAGNNHDGSPLVK